MRRIVLIAAPLLLITAPLLADPALAAPIRDQTGVTVREEKKKKSDSSEDEKSQTDRFAKSANRARTAQRALEQEWAVYAGDLAKYQTCMGAARSAGVCAAPIVPPAAGSLTGIPIAGPAIDPQTAAYIAFARLRLTPPTPVINPSPSINPWKMAAVGYPLWLSAGGNTHPPGVSDSVAGLRVTLEARVAKVTFNMGDGHTVTCVDVTKKWTSSVRAGAKSPNCGYTYRKPSLPNRKYTVTATTSWSVAWSTSTESGVIDFAQSAKTQLPVGELQVLVR